LKLIRPKDEDENENGWCHKPTPPSISIRLDTKNQWNTILDSTTTTGGGAGCRSVTLAGRTSIHPRIDIVAKSTTQFDHHVPNGGDEEDATHQNFFSNRIPPRVVKGWKEGVWIPLISMTPGGRVSSKNAFGFRAIPNRSPSATDDGGSGGGSSLSSSSSRWYDGMQTGIRLVVSRQLNWNALGLSSLSSSSDTEHSSSSWMGEHLTFLRLELSGLDHSGRTFRCVTLEGAVERLRESARVTLLQERVVRNKRNN